MNRRDTFRRWCVFWFVALLCTTKLSAQDVRGFLASTITPENTGTGFDEGSMLFWATLDDTVIASVAFDPDDEVQVIVQFKTPPLLSSKAQRQFLVGQIEGEHAQFQADLQQLRQKATQKATGALLSVPNIRHEYRLVFNGAALSLPSRMVSALRKLPGIRRVYWDREVKTLLGESVPFIGADQVWQELGWTGKGVIVGVIDTGIDYTHSALGGGFGVHYKVVGGYDFVNEDNDPMDDEGHGTHVAGIIAGNDPEWKGVAPDAKLMAFKVLNASGSGRRSDVIAGVEMAVDPDGNPATDDAVDVINMSLGGPGNPDDPLCQALDVAVEVGVVCVVSAGNDFMYNSIGSPACAHRAITVGASHENEVARFSSKGPSALNENIKPDLVAPGVDIESSVLGGRTEEHSGTSMAAPHVAGVTALLLEGHPEWAPDIVKGVLCGTTVDLGKDVYTQGSGRLDAWRAANTTTAVVPNNLGLGTNDLGLNAFQTQKGFAIHNLGDETASYGLFLRHQLPSGVNVAVDPISMVLEPGTSGSVNVTMSVDNNVVLPSEQFPANLEGWVDMVSEKDTLTIPFSLHHGACLEITFNDYPDVFHCFRKPRSAETLPLLHYLDPDSFMTLLLPVGEYDLKTDYDLFSDRPFSIVLKEDVKLDGFVSETVSQSDANLGFGLALPAGREDRPDLHMMIFHMRSQCSKFQWTYKRDITDIDQRFFLSPISDFYHLVSLNVAKEGSSIYFVTNEADGISEDLTFLAQPDQMQSVEYSVNIDSLTPEHLRDVRIWATLYRGWRKYMPSEPFRPPQSRRYRVYYHTQPLLHAGLRLEIMDRDFQETDELWKTDYMTFHENEIVMSDRGGHVRHYPFTSDCPYFGLGVSPPVPKTGIRPGSSFISIPPSALVYQFGDYSNAPWPPSYKLLRDTTLVAEGTPVNNKVPMPQAEGRYRLELLFPNAIQIGSRVGDVQMAADFDNRNSDVTPPHLKELRILSDGNFIDPDRKPTQVVVSAAFKDDGGISDVRFQAREAWRTEWHDLIVTSEGNPYMAEVPDSLFRDWIDIRLVASDHSGNCLTYTLLPAYQNQAARLVADARTIPGYILPNQTVTLQARVYDEEGVAQVMAEVESPDETVLDALPLFDDGLHGDGIASDEVFANQWTTLSNPADYYVDLYSFNGLGNQEVYDNVLTFTTRDVPFLRLAEKETSRRPSDDVGSLVIKNIGVLEASNTLLHVEPDAADGISPSRFDRPIGDIGPGGSVSVTTPFSLSNWVPDSSYRRLFITMSSGERHWEDTLTIFVAGNPGPLTESERVDPRNAATGADVVVESIVRDELDGVLSVKTYFFRGTSEAMIDSIVLQRDGATDYYRGKWTTSPKPRDYQVLLWTQDSLGNIRTDRTALAFTTRSIPSGANDVLIIGTHPQATDASLSTVCSALKANAQSFDLWNTYYRGECCAPVLEHYFDKGVMWRPQVFYPTVWDSIANTEQPDEQERYNLKRFLDRGGRLLVSQALFARQVRYYDDELPVDYLPYDYVTTNQSVGQLVGVPGDPVSDSLTLDLCVKAPVDIVEPQPPAVAILRTPEGETAGFRVSKDDYHAVLLPFAFEDVADEQQRNLLLERSLHWLRTAVSGIDGAETGELPASFALFPNYPNPFNPRTVIRYQLPQSSKVTLRIYDLLGQEAVTLVDDQTKKPGVYLVTWDGRDRNGMQLASGVYFCYLEAGRFKSVQKMVLVK